MKLNTIQCDNCNTLYKINEEIRVGDCRQEFHHLELKKTRPSSRTNYSINNNESLDFCSVECILSYLERRKN